MVRVNHIKLSKRISKIALMSIVLLSLTYIVAFANAKKGGTLYYSEDGGTTWIPVVQFYDILPDQTCDLKVCDIPAPLGNIVFLKVSSDDDDGWTEWYVPAGPDRCIEFTWTCPSDAYYCNTFVVQLKKGVEDDPYKPSGAAYIVEGTIIDDKDKIAHLHVIPEYAFGTIMAMLSTFSGLAAYSKFRKK